MTCHRCNSHMCPVMSARPEEIIEVDNLDFVGCREVIIWCCERCGETRINCLDFRMDV